MANFYLDISAIGNEYQAYTDTPTTWAVPQDGNGKAGPGHTAAVAIATIDVAGCTGTSASVGVMGVSLTGLSATGAALATAIAAAINASATAVSATYSALLLPLNKLVYARVDPGLSTRVQIMLRIAGTDWVGFTPTQSSISPAATISNFAGGANGPFAYFLTSSTVFGKTSGNYGTHAVKTAAVTDPSAADDLVYVRTERSGADLTCPFSLSSAAYITPTANRNFIFDAGNTWSGDSGRFILAVSFTASTAFGLGALSSNGTMAYNAEAEGGFTITATSTASGSSLFVNARNSTSNKQRYSNCVFEELNTNVGVWVYGMDASWSHFTDCVFKLKSSHALFQSGFGAMAFLLDGGRLEYSGLSADVPTLFALSNNQSIVHYRLRNFTCVDVAGGVWKVTTPMNGLSNLGLASYLIAEFDNVSGFRAPSFGFNAYAGARPQHTGFYQSSDGDRPFRHENNLYAVDWIDDGSFPTAGALLPSGNEWSMRCTWRTSISRYDDCTPITLNAFYRDSSGVKTITLEMLCADSETPKTGDLYLTVSYTDSTGVRRIEKSPCSYTENTNGTDAALTTGGLTWNYNGLSGFSPKKIALTTAHAVKISTSVTVTMTLCGTPATDTSIYVHPEIVFS